MMTFYPASRAIPATPPERDTSTVSLRYHALHRPHTTVSTSGGYAVFLMTDKAVNYLKESKGWEIGVGPTVVVVDEGVTRNLSTSSLKDDAYAFIFSQQGLMAGVSIEGTKISRIDR